MLTVDHPVRAIIVVLGVIAFFKIIFWLGDFLTNLGNSKKSSAPAKKEEKKEEKPPVKTEKPIEKETTSKSISSANSNVKSDTNNNYLYDRFVINPTKDDKNNCYQKINDAFLENNVAEAIKNNKVKIKVEPADLNAEKNKRIQEILNNAESRQKLIEEFSAMPKEMKLLMIENLLKKM